MALLKNPMGTLVAVNRAATTVTGKPVRAAGAATARRVGALGPGNPVASQTWADRKCRIDNPSTTETKKFCDRYCHAMDYNSCPTTCSHVSDGRGGCDLKIDCAPCEEVPDDLGDLARVLQ